MLIRVEATRRDSRNRCLLGSCLALCLARMLLIAAALEEELNTAKALYPDAARVPADSVKLWRAVRRNEPVYFLRAGVGPRRSAESLERALGLIQPSHILVIGYAGALDPELKLGSLIAVRKASAFSLEDTSPSWEHVRIDGEFVLHNCESLLQSAGLAGVTACAGDILTSSHVLGEPEHKNLLFERFHASVVDMETAALARVAHAQAIPIACMRAISDEARDSFLAPFSYDPSAGIPERARKLLRTGMVETLREWKANTATAKESLSRFLLHHL